AAGYLNQVRERAGITVPLTAAEVDFDRIVHERYVELAFEGLYFFDLRRWRLGHIIFDGVEITEDQVTQNIGSATKRQTQPWGVWPYKYIEPGSPDDGKWIFEIVKPDRVTGADRFRFGNYYSEIAQDILTNNPLLVRNPNQ
ncbi:MAG TPA: RagB/SusD family nutrient uptake outer membrane protein, partial [Pricia sp.]|nr:RagB/SusD family nutrient uptake outer membrane protein [Pricia sp.]